MAILLDFIGYMRHYRVGNTSNAVIRLAIAVNESYYFNGTELPLSVSKNFPYNSMDLYDFYKFNHVTLL